MAGIPSLQLNLCTPADFYFSQPLYGESRQLKLSQGGRNLGICGIVGKRSILVPIKAMESSKTTSPINGNAGSFRQSGCNSGYDVLRNECDDFSDKSMAQMSTIGNSTNIVWHKCIVEKSDRQQLLGQKGCAIWITGLSGSGKSTLACALSHGLHARGKLTYILDGDNVRHGLNSDLGFKAEDRAGNIRRIGEVAKLFSDAGKEIFLEVFMDVPLRVCETRDPKGLYKLARTGKIKGFTGVDDLYESPLNSEIVLHQHGGMSDSPTNLAEIVISYLETKGYLEA
ncbi:adenylyl-sulfate kinase 3-like [Olea europaea subsp. europaea]|uniref:Adenylyl-sulfate kinase 3-like n=1 Tax=Olea europaea subsp. europaea TaxID=158383 RepID=A0A8S0RIE8_OLEEU|nr:adenylyl-sulfate kinase 3-like [Olea europaea subsp. europaea]